MLQMAGTATGSAVRSSFNRKTMKNDKRCSIAWARFDALRRNIPSWLKREQVAECHWIVDAVQSIRNILEGMTGSLIASGLLFEIGKYVR